jgi:UDP-N-acetylmuramate: L-alanyl-gamma-D-glutamyl-meso-diaminopimelate ligase
MEDFLPQYARCMDEADVAMVYYDPEIIEQKRLKQFEPEQVKTSFGKADLQVFTNKNDLEKALKSLDYKNSALLLMSSGNFSGLNVNDIVNEKISL